MNKILSFILLAAVCCCVVSCNEKPKKEQTKTYKFVKQMADGEQAEDFEAVNDTDALNKYFARMEKIIIANIGKENAPIDAMYVISPEGDTLNKNEELLQAVMKDVPMLKDPSEKTPLPAPGQQSIH